MAIRHFYRGIQVLFIVSRCRIRVWWYRGELTLAACIRHNHTGPSPGVMVWGALGYTSQSPLVRTDSETLRFIRFLEGRQSVHDEERSGRPSLINDDLVERVLENRRFTITELSSHFLQISRSLFHEIVTKYLLLKKLCASPDLASSDFHVFLHHKKFLSSGERFGNDEELKTFATRRFHSQAAGFYDRGI
ncbi:uncharacterized protein TNCV_3422211 [Trichonephila clavipes]|nr:uncharacterized protein TNCV_3422211 [Trichonephila clavipes]